MSSLLYLSHAHERTNTQPNLASASGSATQPLLPVLDQNVDLDGGDMKREAMDGEQLLNKEKKALVRRKLRSINKVSSNIQIVGIECELDSHTLNHQNFGYALYFALTSFFSLYVGIKTASYTGTHDTRTCVNDFCPTTLHT